MTEKYLAAISFSSSGKTLGCQISRGLVIIEAEKKGSGGWVILIALDVGIV